MIVSPSILSCDFLNIENEIKHFDGVKDLWLHLDIMDGHFVPNLTFGTPIVKMISKKTQTPLDAHFMVTNPEFYIESMKDFGLANFTFHHEAAQDSLQMIEKAKQYFPSVGVSIRPKTPVSALSDDVLKALNLVLVMSVEPGFGGQSFIESTYDKIKELRERESQLETNFMIQIDGGVSNVNSKALIEAGADNLVAGSYVFKGGPSTYLDKVESLRG